MSFSPELKTKLSLRGAASVSWRNEVAGSVLDEWEQDLIDEEQGCMRKPAVSPRSNLGDSKPVSQKRSSPWSKIRGSIRSTIRKSQQERENKKKPDALSVATGRSDSSCVHTVIPRQIDSSGDVVKGKDREEALEVVRGGKSRGTNGKGNTKREKKTRDQEMSGKKVETENELSVSLVASYDLDTITPTGSCGSPTHTHREMMEKLADERRQNTKSVARILMALSPFVPRLVKDQIQERLLRMAPQANVKELPTNSGFLPRVKPLLGAVMIADITGFTKMTESLSKQGTQGVEILTKGMNNYFAQIIDLVNAYEGDVIKFAGDSLIVAFYPTTREVESEDGGLELATTRSVACAVAMTEQLGEMRLLPNGEVLPTSALEAASQPRGPLSSLSRSFALSNFSARQRCKNSIVREKRRSRGGFLSKIARALECLLPRSCLGRDCCTPRCVYSTRPSFRPHGSLTQSTPAPGTPERSRHFIASTDSYLNFTPSPRIGAAFSGTSQETKREFTLSLKVIIGTGTMYAFNVGGESERSRAGQETVPRWEFFIGDKPHEAADSSGFRPPIMQIASIEEHAEACDVIVSREVIEVAGSMFDVDELTDGAGRVSSVERDLTERFRTSDAAYNAVSHAHTFTLLPTATQMQSAGVMRTYLLDCVRHRLEAGHMDFISEVRRLTLLFIGFPELTKPTSASRRSSACSESIAERDECADVQACMVIVQKAMRDFDGSLLQFRCDEKGFVSVCAFGLAGRSHEQQSVRGIKAALRIVGATKAINQKAAIGVTSGDLLCACVGSRTRAEYTVYGDAINLSARLTCKAKSGLGDILCDHQTRDRAHQKARFVPLEPVSVKGKDDPIFVYSVREAKPSGKRRHASHTRQLSGPMTMLGKPMVGREEILGTVKQRVVEIVSEGAGHRGGIVLIEGEAGMGKSKLVREIQRKYYDPESSFWLSMRKESHLFFGAGHYTHRSEILYPWRRILREIFSYDRILEGVDPTCTITALGGMLEERVEDYALVWRKLLAETLHLPLEVVPHGEEFEEFVYDSAEQMQWQSTARSSQGPDLGAGPLSSATNLAQDGSGVRKEGAGNPGFISVPRRTGPRSRLNGVRSASFLHESRLKRMSSVFFTGCALELRRHHSLGCEGTLSKSPLGSEIQTPQPACSVNTQRSKKLSSTPEEDVTDDSEYFVMTPPSCLFPINASKMALGEGKEAKCSEQEGQRGLQGPACRSPSTGQCGGEKCVGRHDCKQGVLSRMKNPSDQEQGPSRLQSNPLYSDQVQLGPIRENGSSSLTPNSLTVDEDSIQASRSQTMATSARTNCETRIPYLVEIIVEVFRCFIELFGSMIVVVEDVHHFDVASWDVLVALENDLPSDGFLALGTLRPNDGNLAHHSILMKGKNAIYQKVLSSYRAIREHELTMRLRLLPFDSTETRELMELVSDGQTIPDDVVSAVLEKSGGVPMYVEQLSQYLKQVCLLDDKEGRVDETLRNDKTIANFIRSTVSIHNLLMDQIDALTPSAHLTLKVMAVIGSDIKLGTILAIYPYKTHMQAVVRDMFELENGGFVRKYEEDDDGCEVWRFNTEVARDAVYALIPQGQRRLLHAKLVEVIRHSGSTPLTSVAYHWTKCCEGVEAGEWKRTLKAIAAWEGAAVESMSGGSRVDALNLFQKAVDLSDILGDFYATNTEPIHSEISKRMTASANATPLTPTTLGPPLTSSRSLDVTDSLLAAKQPSCADGPSPLANLPYVSTIRRAIVQRKMADLRISLAQGDLSRGSRLEHVTFAKDHLLRALELLGAPAIGEKGWKHGMGLCSVFVTVFKKNRFAQAAPRRRRPSMSYHLLKNRGEYEGRGDGLRYLTEDELFEAARVTDMLATTCMTTSDLSLLSHCKDLVRFFAGNDAEETVFGSVAERIAIGFTSRSSRWRSFRSVTGRSFLGSQKVTLPTHVDVREVSRFGSFDMS